MQTTFLDRFSPYLLLVLCVLFWAGNFNLARAVNTDIPPLALSFWRWATAGMILLPFAWKSMQASLPLMLKHWKLVGALALLGVAGYNSLVYTGLKTTTATNGVLLQTITPVLTVLLASFVLRERSSVRQWVGVFVSLSGVLVIMTRADPAVLRQLDFTKGDLWMLAATLDWAMYTTLLRKLPGGLKGLPILGFTVVFGALGILPFYLHESITGQTMPFTLISVGSVLYVAIFPSLLSYLFWNHATLKLGAGRTGQFSYLLPVFGILLAVLFLGEKLHLYHAVGMALVAVGLLLTNWRRK